MKHFTLISLLYQKTFTRSHTNHFGTKNSTNNQNPKQFYVDSRKWAFFILRLRACDLILNDLNTLLDLKCELQHAKHPGQKLFCPEERRHIHVFTLIRVGVPEPQRVGEHLQAILVFVLF